MTFHVRKIDYKDLFWEPHEKILRWCEIPYPDHPRGCPNSSTCRFFRNDLRRMFALGLDLHIAWVEFDLDAWAASMRKKYPKWSDKQCRNLLYWQRSVRNHLRMEIATRFPGCPIFMGSEGGGINFYRTMGKLGVKLDKMSDLHKVRVIAIVVGKANNLERFR